MNDREQTIREALRHALTNDWTKGCMVGIALMVCVQLVSVFIK